MKFDNGFLIAKFIKRYKRFLVDCELNEGIITAYNPNTGSMKGLLNEGCRVALSVSDNPKRKFRYTVEAFELDNNWVYTNTVNVNNIVKKSIEENAIRELSYYDYLKPEFQIEDSRVDFFLERGKEKILVEVKNVTLLKDDTAFFPDAVTKRGKKHLDLLKKYAQKGYTCYIFYVVGVNAIKFNCAKFIDKDYCKSYKEALDCGVKVLTYRHIFDPFKKESNLIAI